MEKYIIVVINRSDYYDRYWVTRNTLEEAQKVAREYEKDNKFQTSIYKIEDDLK